MIVDRACICPPLPLSGAHFLGLVLNFVPDIVAIDRQVRG